MAEYALTNGPAVIRTADGLVIPTDPANPDYQAFLAWDAVPGNDPDPAPALPLQISETVVVQAGATTTNATATEIFRFACDTKRVYQGNLTIFGIDRGNGAAKAMEGRFVWKRLMAGALMSGITVVSDIHDAAAAAWAPNALPSGNDIVFTVQGAAGRTIDWLLLGAVGVFAPGGVQAP